MRARAARTRHRPATSTHAPIPPLPSSASSRLRFLQLYAHSVGLPTARGAGEWWPGGVLPSWLNLMLRDDSFALRRCRCA
eukprot:1139263-Prymnesium_polylepis.1